MYCCVAKRRLSVYGRIHEQAIARLSSCYLIGIRPHYIAEDNTCCEATFYVIFQELFLTRTLAVVIRF